MADDRPSTPTLIGDAIRQATGLVTAELQLAKLEAAEKVSLLIASLVSLAAAAVFIIVALIFLLEGLVGLLAHLLGWDDWQASLLVGGVVAVVALLAVALAAMNLSGSRLKPKRTLKQLHETGKIMGSAR